MSTPALNQKLLVSSAAYFSLDKHINPYYNNNPVNRAKAMDDHATIVQAFRAAGIEVIQVPAPPNCQDGVYTANWALVKDGHAVLARLPNARKQEEPHAQKILQNLGFITRQVPENWLFSGQGDSLICGNLLFAGSGYRSDEKAQAFAAKTLNLQLVQLHTLPQTANHRPVINPASGLPDSFFYDLDLALAVLDHQTIAYCPEAFDTPSRQKINQLPLQKIEVSLEEAQKGFALNLVSTGKTVIMSNTAPIFAATLAQKGFHPLPRNVQ
jgi:N-dimethylarginine dimethylaminohydrolase